VEGVDVVVVQGVISDIFVARTRYRHLRVKHFPSFGSKIILFSLRCKSFREIQCPVLEKCRIPQDGKIGKISTVYRVAFIDARVHLDMIDK
jgi:hypothetical protein